MNDTVDFLAEFEDQNPSLNKAKTNKNMIYQKKIIKDDDICDFFSRISDIENLIFYQLSQCIDNDLTQSTITPVTILIKICNSLLDIKKKQLEIKRITNFSNKKKNKSNKSNDESNFITDL